MSNAVMVMMMNGTMRVQYILGPWVFNLSGEGDGLKAEWQAEALSLSGVKEGKAAVDSSPEQGTTIKMEDPQIKSLKRNHPTHISYRRAWGNKTNRRSNM
jgi:hypothetical protein